MPSLGHASSKEKLPAELVQEVAALVRQDVRAELSSFLNELHGFSRELGQSLGNFLDRVDNIRYRMSEQEAIDESNSRKTECSLVPLDLDAAAEAAANNVEVPMKLRTEDQISKISSSSVDLSLRPGSQMEEPLVAFVRHRLHDIEVIKDGADERLIGDWQLVLTWCDPRIPMCSKDQLMTATLPTNVWRPISSKSNCFAKVNEQSEKYINLDSATIGSPIFSPRAEHFPLSDGAWLSQDISNIKIEKSMVDTESLRSFPEDMRQLELFFTVWCVENVCGCEKQMLRLKPDLYMEPIWNRPMPIHFVGRKPGGTEWHFLELETWYGTHVSPNTGIEYSNLGISAHLQRNSGYYFWKARVPLLSAVVMQMFVFCVRPYSEEGVGLRLSTCLAAFFSIVAIQLTMIGSLPKANTLHKLDRFTLTLYIFIIVTMFESACLHWFSVEQLLPLEKLDIVDNVSACAIVVLLFMINVALEIWAKQSKNVNQRIKWPRMLLTVEEALGWKVNALGQLDEVSDKSFVKARISRFLGLSSSNSRN